MGRVKAFDDVYSWLHFAYAFLVAFLEPVLAVAASVIFYAYQRFERERWEVNFQFCCFRFPQCSITLRSISIVTLVFQFCCFRFLTTSSSS